MNERQIIIVVLVIIGIALLWYAANKPAEIKEYDARNFVINDVQGKYPEGDIEVLSTNFSAGSYKIKVKATLNASFPCPERIHLYYDYPAQQFATGLPEHITKDCKVCINVPDCVLIFPEEALIASHTFPGTEEIAQFLQEHPSATGTVTVVPVYETYSNVWNIEWGEWNGPEVQGQYVILDDRGRVLEVGDWGSDAKS
ncbi:MAG: hypothetical protein ABIF01_02900 [Candidatus Micrarchaeota archaeon]